ncbi:MAG: nicotinamide riboside transporter PnuC [Sarcina sp.]
MQFFKNFTLFQKAFFLFFTAISIIAFLLPALILGKSYSSLFSSLGILGLVCTISGILVSIYTAKASISGYVWWWVNTGTFAIIALAGHLYGQFIQNIFILLPLQVYGFIAWRRNMTATKSNKIAIRKFTKKQTILYISVAIICFILYAIFLRELPNILHSLFGITVEKDPQIILDSITSTLTIIAVYLTGKRFVEQWNFWLVSNSLGLIMFIIQTTHAGVSDPAMFVGDLSNTISILQYGIGAIYGFILWRGMYKKYLQKSNLKVVA